jgi:hypothetical protein
VSQPSTSTARPGLAKAHIALAYLMPVLVLVQAALAGRHLFEGSSISVHGVLGELTFALTVVGLVLAVVRRCDGVVFAVAVALMALAFAQVGLGFVGRDTAAAAAWHIPTGVAIFGLTTYQLALLTRR